VSPSPPSAVAVEATECLILPAVGSATLGRLSLFLVAATSADQRRAYCSCVTVALIKLTSVVAASTASGHRSDEEVLALIVDSCNWTSSAEDLAKPPGCCVLPFD
jgi:hypothetical protein